jgi:Zn-dependent protease
MQVDDQVFLGVVQFIVLLLSLSVHESAHAWTADVLGDPTARYLGRVSLNPIVHADLFGTIIFPLIGLFSLNGLMFGWAKPVPVNVGRLRHPTRDHMLVAAAGPASNLLIAVGLTVCLLIMKGTSPDAAVLVRQVASFDLPRYGHSILVPMLVVAFRGIVLNLILAVFNLIPIAPLDGAAVLSGLLPRELSGALDQFQAYGFMILIALVFLGIPALLYTPVVTFFINYLIL